MVDLWSEEHVEDDQVLVAGHASFNTFLANSGRTNDAL